MITGLVNKESRVVSKIYLNAHFYTKWTAHDNLLGFVSMTTKVNWKYFEYDNKYK